MKGVKGKMSHKRARLSVTLRLPFYKRSFALSYTFGQTYDSGWSFEVDPVGELSHNLGAIVTVSPRFDYLDIWLTLVIFSVSFEFGEIDFV